MCVWWFIRRVLRAWGCLVLEERAGEVDVVERVGDGPLGLGVHVGLHARHAVVRHLLREVLWSKRYNQIGCLYSNKTVTNNGWPM